MDPKYTYVKKKYIKTDSIFFNFGDLLSTIIREINPELYWYNPITNIDKFPEIPKRRFYQSATISYCNFVEDLKNMGNLIFSDVYFDLNEFFKNEVYPTFILIRKIINKDTFNKSFEKIQNLPDDILYIIKQYHNYNSFKKEIIEHYCHKLTEEWFNNIFPVDDVSLLYIKNKIPSQIKTFFYVLIEYFHLWLNKYRKCDRYIPYEPMY